jgi:hypothetical protein
MQLHPGYNFGLINYLSFSIPYPMGMKYRLEANNWAKIENCIYRQNSI